MIKKNVWAFWRLSPITIKDISVWQRKLKIPLLFAPLVNLTKILPLLASRTIGQNGQVEIFTKIRLKWFGKIKVFLKRLLYEYVCFNKEITKTVTKALIEILLRDVVLVESYKKVYFFHGVSSTLKGLHGSKINTLFNFQKNLKFSGAESAIGM